ncbi:MAG: hypothetical protein QOI98_2112, partial [Solirubrobacteraceae bacterium]|nr:hypothetical protein [Solirubrobacteraceae bacterium]
KRLRYIALLAAGGALLVAPVAGQAKPNHPTGPHKAKRCERTPRVGFVVRGTLTSFTADDPATTANESSVTITVKGANRHARHSGELADSDPNKAGTQVAGDSYTVNGATDAFRLRLVGYAANEAPATGDAVRISGLIPRTKAKCADAGTSLADRYGAPNVRRVTVHNAP